MKENEMKILKKSTIDFRYLSNIRIIGIAFCVFSFVNLANAGIFDDVVNKVKSDFEKLIIRMKILMGVIMIRR